MQFVTNQMHKGCKEIQKYIGMTSEKIPAQSME
jgi:hypothetical protein